MTRVVILGGASAAPRAGQGCSGYLIVDDSTHIVLDLGPGTLPELLRHCSLEDVSAIVISHMHVDHMLDLIALWWGWLYNPQPLAAPVPLWLPPGGVEPLRQTLSALGRPDEVERFFGDLCDVTEFSPDESLELVDAALTFAPTAHFVPCWAVRVDLPHAAIAYTADTGPAADLTALAQDADLLIAESMLVGPFDESDNRGSSTPTEAATLARNARIRRLLLTHMWTEEDAGQAQTEASRIFDGFVATARRGMVIEI